MAEWQEELPEDVREWDEVKNSADPEAFWKQVGDMRSSLGQSIRIPSEEAGDEDLKTFNEKIIAKVPTLMPRIDPENAESLAATHKLLGHPDAAEGYSVENPDKVDLTRVEAFKGVAHKHGLTQKQFTGVITEIVQSEQTKQVEHETKHNESMQTLRTDWGLAYDGNMEKAKNLVKATSGPADLIKAVEEGRVGAESLIWLKELSDRLGGENNDLIKNKTELTGDELAPAEARARLNEILGDKKNPYWDRQHPSNADMIAKVMKLQAMANPNASTSFNDLRIGGRASA